MLSFWESTYFIAYDYIIIGGGIVGLTTAFYLRKKFPNAAILILEYGLLPSGASTKNAGFACIGSPSELLHDLQSMTEKEVLNLFALRKSGLERLKSILTPDQIGYEANGSYELISEDELYCLHKIDYLNDLLFPLIGKNAFTICNEKLNGFGFNQYHIKSLVENTCEGEIDTGLMMKNLIALILSLRIEIKTGCEVQSFHDIENEVQVNCKHSAMNEMITFKAKKAFVCTNAFAKKLLPELDIQAGRGQVLITKPISNLPFKGIFHWQQGYYYFRVFEQRILFGGGRNLDFQKENTTKFELNEMILQNLKHKLKEVILPNHDFDVEQQWSGIMAFGTTKKCIIKKHSSNVFVGVRMNGMGIAIGSEVGFQLSNLI
jgi:gamma-glutamylputrescine oxidase